MLTVSTLSSFEKVSTDIMNYYIISIKTLVMKIITIFNSLQ